MMDTRGKSAKRNSFVEPESPVKRRARKLEDALSFLTSLNPGTSLRGNVRLHLAVDEIVNWSMAHGLDPQQIAIVADVVLNPKQKLSQAIRTKLVKCLIPSTKVPQQVIAKVIACVSTKIFHSPGPTNLHTLLLRWILLIFEYIDGYDQLHRLYGIIFNFVNSYRLLPHACHLLYLLTKKDNVKLFRVHKLMELIRKVGPEPCITGLLVIYKVFCPHLVSMRLDHSHRGFFKAHDKDWRSTISAVRKQRQDEDKGDEEEVEEIENRKKRAKLQPRSKTRKLTIPESHSAAEEVEGEIEESPGTCEEIPYTQIESFTSFLEALDKIKYPSQIAASLDDSRLQILLSCDPDPIAMARLSFWIQHFFAFEFRGADRKDSKENEVLLHMLLKFSQNVQNLGVVDQFLTSYLPTWDGQSYAPYIFSLITCVRPGSYLELYSDILEPLRKLFFTSDVYFKSMCITALTKLIHNWALHCHGQITPSGGSDKTQEVQQPVRPSSQAEEEPNDPAGTNQASTDLDLDGETRPGGAGTGAADYQEIIFQLIRFCDSFVVVGMRMEEDHYLLQSSTLDFLDLISQLNQKYNIPLVCLPMHLMHRLLLSDCTATLARLCGIVNAYREAFVHLKHNVVMQNATVLTQDSLPADQSAAMQLFQRADNNEKGNFNALLLDVVGMLWQGRMFKSRKHKYESIFHFPMPSQLETRLADNSLTLYTHPAFLALAYKFLKETQRKDKKLHPLQIEDFKDTYLQFLERENFGQFKELVNTNIKSRKIKN